MGIFGLIFFARLVIRMRTFLLFVVSSAVSQNTCEQENEIFKSAILKLAKKEVKTDCDDCYSEILAAVTDCIMSFEWKKCVEDILGGGTPCIECVCEVIADISNIFNLDWSC